LPNPVLAYSKDEHHFPYLKAAAQELMVMKATSAPSEQVFSHVGKLYSVKGTNIGVVIFAILVLLRLNPYLVGHELNLD